jgi:hypothetical protein
MADAVLRRCWTTRMAKTLARGLAIFGSILFIVGWALTIYLVFDPGRVTAATSSPAQRQIVIALVYGTQVTLASALLWGVAAYLYFRPDPHTPASS